MLIRTQWQIRQDRPVCGHDYESPTGVSLTVPDQSYSLKELLARAMANAMPAIAKDVYYEEDPNLDDENAEDDLAFDLLDAVALKGDLDNSIRARKGHPSKKNDEEEKEDGAPAPGEEVAE